MSSQLPYQDEQSKLHHDTVSMKYIFLLQPNVNINLEYSYISTSVASASDPGTMTLEEALQQPNLPEFIKVMYKE